MELTDSSEIHPARSPLFIDLNEIPSSSSSSPPPATSSLPPARLDKDGQDPLDLVRLFHESSDPAPGVAAGLPVEVAGECGVCGKPEVQGHVVVCDGCERGFHLGCVGMHGRPVANLTEWLCGECVSNGVKSKLWPLGVKSKRILDINASPPSDGDVETNEERRHAVGDNSFGAPVACSNLLCADNGFGLRKGSRMLMQAFRVDFEDMLHHRVETVDSNLENVELGFPLGTLRCSSGNGDSAAVRLPSWNPSEIFLQGLREFISGRHGVLEEGWHVEFKQSMSSYDVYAVYCSPNGMTFGSMSEVACHLGLTPNGNSIDAEARSDGPPSVQRSLYLPKRRKTKRFSLANGFSENKGRDFINGYCKELSSNGHSIEISDATGQVTESEMEDEITTSQPYTEELPIQFEDFFVLALGKIDARPSYHDVSMIWPIGYRSCWHDKVTGSLFMSEVSDGGDSGPVFKVRRFSCSTFPVPDGLTVLLMTNFDQLRGQNGRENNDMMCYKIDEENDGSVDMILAETSPPTDNDVLACFDSISNGTADSLQTSSVNDGCGNLSSCNLVLGEEIGEISVEEHSLSSAWRMMTEKLLNAYCEIYRRKGTVKFSCNHAHEMGSPPWDAKDAKGKVGFASLAKFCCPPSHVRFLAESQFKLDTLSSAVSEWLDQDRVGLDTEFVQEIIEQLPGVDACLKYERLVNRVHYPTSLTVGNGLLVAKRNYGDESDDSFLRSKKPRLAEENVMGDQFVPPGKPLFSRLPSMLVGDFYQVWELLHRFHEMLGMKEPFALEELEEELINPWSDGSDLSENIQKKTHGSQFIDLHRVDGINGKISPSCDESHLAASLVHSRCCGVALTKIHSSLLGVLVSELQLKVAALVDPNFDSGESKSRRGRKKDADSSIPARISKLSMLPINELTWPELARRYILAVLTMDGNLDSTEITARESGKVFRCLQGDGGVLCGSLTGVASMEADALLLAEAMRKVFGSLLKEENVITLEEVAEESGAYEKNSANDGNMPEWAQVLEPVKKLPTNVGTRIRKCVYEALEKCPPEWAKKRLAHSISKEVYKGNASGPTKKAVLSVLADAVSEQKSANKMKKRKIAIPMSDIIMKRCRIVLRRAAAADDTKVFCTLLGRNLVNSCDNDDEGLLGSPAMVSHPLDFRTIDLRLTVGAYGGSHESFLEDTRELWNNLRTAFGDQPDLVELAETLSQNFESLYEEEVLALIQKLEGYSKLDKVNAETKKEIDDILASSNEIPKAPWDEGICKVCGVDRDDDSVLLCDTCDAEYHTYCLNPPLARIPEGNWYCPSCAVSKRMVQEASGSTRVIGRSHGKQYQGEATHSYLEALSHLAIAAEEKEYWQFSVDERMNLLKFLCDELLNSALIRQHLEQSAETTAELLQKLRSLATEWKNLKAKEEFLSLRATKIDASAVGEVPLQEGLASALVNQGKCMGQPPNLSDGPSLPELNSGQDRTGINGFDKLPPVSDSEKHHSINSGSVNPVDNTDRVKDLAAVTDDSSIPSDAKDTLLAPNQLAPSNHLPQLIDGGSENQFQVVLKGCVGSDSSTGLPPPDHQGICQPSEINADLTQHASPVAMNESHTHHLELSTVKNDILHLQNLIASLESQILKLSMRREFLGSDSRGHLYWASITSGSPPRVIVDRSLTLQQSKKSNHRDLLDNGSVVWNSHSSCLSTCFEGSQACFPFIYNPNYDITMCFPWVSYETDSEIEELIGSLEDNNQKERELKESISQWRRSRFQETQSRNLVQEEHQEALSQMTNSDKIAFSNCFVTKAARILEKYDPCVGVDAADIAKKRSKRARVISEEKMYRCDCLEPVLPFGHHCASCHRTFLEDVEFAGHNDGRCNSVPSANGKSQGTNDSLHEKGNLKPMATGEVCASEVNMVETSKSGSSELSSRVIKYHNESICPYDFSEISTRFVTKDSNKELMQEIGLIGSKGIPSFVISTPPYLNDSISALIPPQKDGSAIVDKSYDDKRMIGSEANRNETSAGLQSVNDGSSRNAAAKEVSKVLETNPKLGCLELKDKKLFLDKRFQGMGSGCCCVVPQSSLRPLIGRSSQILKRLKIDLLDMEAALPESALKPSKARLERRWAWRAHVKAANSIYEMVQATIILEEMIKTEYLRNEWWYWSSLSAAAKTSTVASLALRIYSLDAAIIYEKATSNSDQKENLEPSSMPDQETIIGMEPVDKGKGTRKSNRKRKEPEG